MQSPRHKIPYAYASIYLLSIEVCKSKPKAMANNSKNNDPSASSRSKKDD